MQERLTIEEIDKIFINEQSISKQEGFTWKVDEEVKYTHPSEGVFIQYWDKLKNNKLCKNIEIYNSIYECDNLLCMIALLNEKNLKSKFDIIIFDPPYNTKDNSKPYNDKINNWSSFMYKRLALAKELLSDEGVIYLCINDKNLCVLKLLCDKVFNKDNYINLIGVKTSTDAGNSRSPKKLRKDLEYILVYCKSYEKCKFKRIKLKMNFSDKIDKTHYNHVMINPGNKKLIYNENDRKIYLNENYKINTINKICKLESSLSKIEVYIKYFDSIFSDTNSDTGIRQYVLNNINNVYKQISTSKLVTLNYKPDKGEHADKFIDKQYWITKGGDIREVIWLKDIAEINNDIILYNKQLGDLWTDINYNSLGKESVISFNDGKKPINLFKRLLNLYDKKDCLIGDFFAGSGTTAEAVMLLNDEDNGCRKFILCNSDEKNICEEKTYNRVKNFYPDINFYKITMS